MMPGHELRTRPCAAVSLRSGRRVTQPAGRLPGGRGAALPSPLPGACLRTSVLPFPRPHFSEVTGAQGTAVGERGTLRGDTHPARGFRAKQNSSSPGKSKRPAPHGRAATAALWCQGVPGVLPDSPSQPLCQETSFLFDFLAALRPHCLAHCQPASSCPLRSHRTTRGQCG